MNVHSRLAFILACCVCAACAREAGPSEEKMEPKSTLQPQLASNEAPIPPAASQPAVTAASDVEPTPKAASDHATEATAEPHLGSMQRAVQSGKLSAPVDVMFKLSDEVAANQPLRVDFAVVPRVAGTELRFELVEPEKAVVESSSKLTVQKADASGVYRKSVALTPRVGSFKLQVIVYMNVGTDSYSGVYSIPVGLEPLERKDGKQSVRREPQ